MLRCWSKSEFEETEIINVLDRLGYNDVLAKKRREIYKYSANGGTLLYKKKSGENVELLVAGSRGEGLGIYFSTDVDKVLIQNSVICYDEEISSVTGTYFARFELDKTDVPSGYARLRLVHLDPSFSEGEYFKRALQAALISRNGNSYLKNDDVLTKAFSRELIWDSSGWITRKLKFSKSKQGPSKPYTARIPFTNLSVSVDDVLAFPCRIDRTMQCWCGRTRIKGWPPADVVDKVRQSRVLVVPVGKKGDVEEKLQWRISFNHAELELVKAFTDLHLKVYVSLKLIFKHCLRPVSRKMSSYIAKNVMFWLLENNGGTDFMPDKFGQRLDDALRLLQQHLHEKHLPNYVIPDRNMFDNLTDTEKVKLTAKTEQLRKRGIYALCVCPDVRTMIKANEERAKEIVIERELREQFILSIFAVEPSQYLEAVKELFEAESKEKVLEVMEQRFIYIRENDHFDFFHHIKTYSDHELIRVFFKGFKRLRKNKVYPEIFTSQVKENTEA